MNSTGASRVPWCSHWKNACWPLVPASPHSAGDDGPASAPPSRRDALAVAFQHQLLQVGRQAEQRLRIGHDDALGMAELRRVPPADEAEQHRQVALEAASCESARRRSRRRRAARRSRSQPSLQRDRQPDRRPQRVAAADPVPQRKDVVGRDAERLRGRRVPGHGDEMRADARRPGRARAPSQRPRARGVGQRLLRRERLRRHDEQRRRGIERGERARQVLGIDVGDERDIDAFGLRTGAAARARRRRERRADEERTEVGAADAEVDDGANRPAGRADAQAAADLRRRASSSAPARRE